jgi:dTDP-glucose pyrophosphorylase/CBS domain-containing protein
MTIPENRKGSDTSLGARESYSRRLVDSLTVHQGATLRHGMEAIEAGGAEIALVVDDSGKLLGTLTDGDVRRALLSGTKLTDPLDDAMNRDFTSLRGGAGRAEALDLMRALTITQIPIVDETGRLLGLHLLREMIGAVPRPNWAVIMAGGRGERLSPVTDTTPKPMITVAGRPVLERIVLHLVGYGIRRIFVSVNYKAEIVERHFGDGSSLGCSIEYLREDQPLGTAGALSLLAERPAEALLVLNGDLLTQFDVGQMLAYHRRARCVATIGIREYSHSIPFGVVRTREGQALSLTEKPMEVWDVNAGVYVLEPELVTRVPKNTTVSMPALLEECLARGEAVGTFRLDDDWIDIGRHDDLRRARGQEDQA